MSLPLNLSSFSPIQLWSITALTRYLRGIFESDEVLQDLWVQGEVSNFTKASSGHIYFTLKDSNSALKIVMFRSAVMRQTFTPRDGQALEVHGNLNIYDARGEYQLYADLFRPAGEGLLYQEFLRLKARLEAEGLFDASRKRPIPRRPQLIGVITSPTAAAFRDILNTLRRRYPLTQVVLAPTAVQGDEAPLGIVAAFESMNRIIHPDVILLARGGGSIEDLWTFNDERVARAVAASMAPVICGVGHETDFTIVDFVCDLRAPTPTAAAEQATPNRVDLQIAIQDLSNQINHSVIQMVSTKRLSGDRLYSRLNLLSPISRVRSHRQWVDEMIRRSEWLTGQRLQISRLRLQGLAGKLNSLSPQAVLRRGFAIVRCSDGDILRYAAQARLDEKLQIQMQDGSFESQVTHTTS